MHVGWGEWIVLDSFLTSRKEPVALRYFDDLGVDPVRAVRLIVATHWHDDHMKGLGDLVSRCPEADFCCASALRSREFLSFAAALARMDLPDRGVREIHTAFSHIDRTNSRPRWATAHVCVGYCYTEVEPREQLVEGTCFIIAGDHHLDPRFLENRHDAVVVEVRSSACLWRERLTTCGWSTDLHKALYISYTDRHAVHSGCGCLRAACWGGLSVATAPRGFGRRDCTVSKRRKPGLASGAGLAADPDGQGGGRVMRKVRRPVRVCTGAAEVVGRCGRAEIKARRAKRSSL